MLFSRFGSRMSLTLTVAPRLREEGCFSSISIELFEVGFDLFYVVKKLRILVIGLNVLATWMEGLLALSILTGFNFFWSNTDWVFAFFI